MELNCLNLTKIYSKDVKALDQFSFCFKPGIYALLGPNGAGKSTLMNILVNLLDPTSGTVYLNGQDVSKTKKEYLSMIGYMPQKQCLYDDFSIYNYLFYIGLLKEMPKRLIKKRIRSLCKNLNLNEKIDDKINTLSGGMKQRVMLAAALINDPKILILDEPTAGLDPIKRIEMCNLISSYAPDTIVIFATHVVSDVEVIAHSFLFLDNGKLILTGSREEVTGKMDGKVKELNISIELYKRLKDSLKVVSVHYEKSDLIVRVVDDEDKLSGKIMIPDIADVYISIFGNRT